MKQFSSCCLKITQRNHPPPSLPSSLPLHYMYIWGMRFNPAGCTCLGQILDWGVVFNADVLIRCCWLTSLCSQIYDRGWLMSDDHVRSWMWIDQSRCFWWRWVLEQAALGGKYRVPEAKEVGQGRGGSHCWGCWSCLAWRLLLPVSLLVPALISQ